VFISLGKSSSTSSKVDELVLDLTELRWSDKDRAFLKSNGYVTIELNLRYKDNNSESYDVDFPIEVYVHLDCRMPEFLDPDVMLIKEELNRVLPNFNSIFQRAQNLTIQQQKLQTVTHQYGVQQEPDGTNEVDHQRKLAHQYNEEQTRLRLLHERQLKKHRERNPNKRISVGEQTFLDTVKSALGFETNTISERASQTTEELHGEQLYGDPSSHLTAMSAHASLATALEGFATASEGVMSPLAKARMFHSVDEGGLGSKECSVSDKPIEEEVPGVEIHKLKLPTLRYSNHLKLHQPLKVHHFVDPELIKEKMKGNRILASNTGSFNSDHNRAAIEARMERPTPFINRMELPILEEEIPFFNQRPSKHAAHLLDVSRGMSDIDSNAATPRLSQGGYLKLVVSSPKSGLYGFDNLNFEAGYDHELVRMWCTLICTILRKIDSTSQEDSDVYQPLKRAWKPVEKRTGSLSFVLLQLNMLAQGMSAGYSGEKEVRYAQDTPRVLKIILTLQNFVLIFYQVLP